MNIPYFLLRDIAKQQTSIGANPAIPTEESVELLSNIVKSELEELESALLKLPEVNSVNVDFLSTRLNILIHQCKERERTIQQQLETICYNLVVEMFNVPDSMVQMETSIVDHIVPTHPMRIVPESEDEIDFNFTNIQEKSNAHAVVMKRRLIDSLIMGAAYSLASNNKKYVSEISKYDKNLIDLYYEIMLIDRFLLFHKKQEITDKNLCQSSLVEVFINKGNKKHKIISQGLTFPHLFIETIRGIFELIASHGLPSDQSKANYILRKSDFVQAEPWDMRLGVGLWTKIFPKGTDTSLIPFMFYKLCKSETKKFNAELSEIFCKTKEGEKIKKQYLTIAQKDKEECHFYDNLAYKKLQQSIIKDDMQNLSIDDLIDEEGNLT